MRPWAALPFLLLVRPPADPVALTVGMWYWHVPFRVTAPERATLRRMAVDTLYVRAGTLSTDGKRVVTILPQRWETRDPGLRIVLTMNFDPGLVSHLGTLPIETMAEDVARCLKDAARLAPRVDGYQLDIDCPTRLLPRYADLLRRVRQEVPGPFSITALPTWLRSPAVRELAAAVDWIAPQFYENRTGRTLDDLQPVSDPAALRRGLVRLRDLGLPFRAGISAYGHALLYDAQGRLAGMYQGLSPGDALRHPALRMESEGPLEAERRLVLRAVSPDANGRGRGAQIAYALPTPEALRAQLLAYREDAPSNALGPILYRFPEPQEAMALPLATQAAALSGRRAKPRLRVTLGETALPWAFVVPGGRSGRPPHAIRVRAEAVGDGPTEARPDAVQVLVRLDRPGVESVAPGDFDRAEPGTLGPDGRFIPLAPLRADVVRLSRASASPGETLRSGAIETLPDGATAAEAEWAAKGPDGDTRGTATRLPLGPARP